MAERKGDWIQTYTGRQFWPLDPRPGEVAIEDIAHALSQLCRYGGHTTRFYSVAEHSVHLSRFVPRADALAALLHDAAEAYLVDVPRPIKASLSEYRTIESGIMAAIGRRFGLPLEMPASVEAADYAILTDERAQVMAPAPEPWATDTAPLGIRVQCWPPRAAEIEFLATFDSLNALRRRRALQQEEAP
jgi:hypothetical protein